MKNKSAFTVVELLIVVSIIAVLSTLSILAYENTQKDARDSTREGIATVIGEALEKYYQDNGEYPSVASLVNNNSVTAEAVASKLKISTNDLKMPKLPSGVTNPLTSTNPPTNDNISYIASSDVNNSNCQSVATSGCDQYTLRYITEGGQTITRDSRNRGRTSGAPTSPDQSTAPTLSAAVSPPNVTATASATAACESASFTPKFAFSYRTKSGNSSTWSGWSSITSSWSVSPSFSVTGTQGTTYEIVVYTRCDDGATAGTSSPASTAASVVYPISAPSAPSATVVFDGSTVNTTTSAVTCVAGATPQYSLRQRINEDAYPAWPAWGVASNITNPTQGYRYIYQPKARCSMTYVVSAESIGNEETYVQPINAPSAPVVSVTPWTGTQIVWNWGAAACPSGTTAEYQDQVSREGWASGWYAPDPATSTTFGTTLQGYQYNLAVQARCYSAYVDGAWSSTGSASTITPIATPGAPTNFTGVLTADRLAYNWSWTAPTCGAGTARALIINAYYNTAWQAEWIGYGFWGPGLGQQAPGGTPYPSGYKVAVRSQYKCVNQTSGRESAVGPIGTSTTITLP